MYGQTGRIVAAIAAIAGVISAIAAAAHESGVYSVLPERYAWIATVLPIVSLLVVSFSERLQGGASDPTVREAARLGEIKQAQDEIRDNSANRPSDTLRCATGLLLIATLAFSGLGFDACKKGDGGITKEQGIAFARDIASSVRSALPLVSQLKPAAGRILEQAIPIADSVISAVERSDLNSTVSLLNQLIPIIDQTVAQFTANVKVLTLLALADIGIHFLINHADDIFGSKAVAKARRGANVATVDAVTQYAGRTVWGCKHVPEKCQP